MPPKPPPTTSTSASTSSTTKPRSAYIETDTGNKISRRCQLYGTQHIVLAGRVVIQTDVCIRGDLTRSSPSTTTSSSANQTTPAEPDTKGAKPQTVTSVTIGRYSYIANGSTLKPPSRFHAGHLSHHPLHIGTHTYIGPSCTIAAASIGDHVHIGANVVIGNMCILKDYCKVLEGSVLSEGCVVASGSVVGGRPARVVGECGEGWGVGEGVEGGEGRERWRAVGTA